MSELPFSVLWTALPPEQVAAGLFPDAPASMQMSVGGMILEVLPTGDGAATVQRLISTCPDDYLDPRWQPGVRVSLPLGN